MNNRHVAVSGSRILFDFRGKSRIKHQIEQAAGRLGNTRTVCRNCYIHPAIIDAYLDHSLVEVLKPRTKQELHNLRSLSGEEAAVLALLQPRRESRLAGKKGSQNGSRRQPSVKPRTDQHQTDHAAT